MAKRPVQPKSAAPPICGTKARRRHDVSEVKRVHILLMENLREEAQMLEDPLLLKFYDMAIVRMRTQENIPVR